MSYWVDKLDQMIEQQKKEETTLTLESIPSITLTEFARRDIAVEIYSVVLESTLWLCSTDKMATRIKKDAPGVVCYTVAELREIIALKPSPADIKKIHEAKVIFSGSTVVEAFRKS